MSTSAGLREREFCWAVNEVRANDELGVNTFDMQAVYSNCDAWLWDQAELGPHTAAQMEKDLCLVQWQHLWEHAFTPDVTAADFHDMATEPACAARGTPNADCVMDMLGTLSLGLEQV